MADKYVAVVDAGSSSIRCFVFDPDGNVVASRSAPWTYAAHAEDGPLAREFDMEAAWRSVRGLLADAIKAADAAPGRVSAVTATSQRQAVVFLDSGGREVYGGPNLDLRAVFEGGVIDQEHRESVYRTTGHTPSFLLAPAKLRWFQLHRPEAYARIASVVTLADWLALRLSGELVSERSLASESGMLDVRTGSWCTDLLHTLGLPGNGHVPLVDAGTAVGFVTPEVSRETGLAGGTTVAVSAADTQCGLLGMGVRRVGEVGVVAGWSVALQMVTGAPMTPPEARTWAGRLAPGSFVLESSAGDAGNSYRWLADTVWANDTDGFDRMDALASEVPPGSEGAMAFLGPSRMEMSRLGMRQGGILFPVPMTMSDVRPGHLARAALEGITYAVGSNLAQVEALARTKAKSIALGGGMTQTRTWVSILANVLGRPVALSLTPHVTAVGAYLCAATATGQFSSLVEASGSVAMGSVEPEPAISAEYQEHLRRWVEASDALGSIAS